MHATSSTSIPAELPQQQGKSNRPNFLTFHQQQSFSIHHAKTPTWTMPEDDAPTTTSTPTRSSPSSWADIFTLPRLLKDLFSHFPLTTYGPNPLPSRSGPHHSPRPVLYIFATPAAAHRNEPSYNPTCLKWQTYLKLSGIEFDAVASNNHASPSGSLPFVLPAHAGTAGKAGGKEGAPVPTGKIRRWVEDQCPGRQEEDKLAMRREVYFSLLDHRLRRAWVGLPVSYSVVSVL